MSEYLTRLRAMLDPQQSTWRLLPSNEEAVRWAVKEIEQLRADLETLYAQAVYHLKECYPELEPLDDV